MLTSKPLSGEREQWPSQMRSDAAEQRVPGDRAGITVFRDITFHAATRPIIVQSDGGPKNELNQDCFTTP
jgi:hypothetical protein